MFWSFMDELIYAEAAGVTNLTGINDYKRCHFDYNCNNFPPNREIIEMKKIPEPGDMFKVNGKEF